MRAVLALLLLTTALLAGCTGGIDDTGTDTATSSSGSSSSATAAPSTTKATTTSASASASTAPANTTTKSSATTSGTSTGAGNGTGGGPAAPAPVTVECTLAGDGQTFAGPTQTVACESPAITSSTGTSFKSGSVTVTYDAVPSVPGATGVTATVTDTAGNELGKASGDSPLKVDLASVPTGASFTLHVAVTASIGPTVGGQDTITGSAEFALA